MRFEWDPAKNRGNARKHGLGFETARGVFSDPLVVFVEDPEPHEERWLAVGKVDDVVIVVAHEAFMAGPDADDEIVRIISARKATAHERKAYEEGDF